jgi:hypothetical protein
MTRAPVPPHLADGARHASYLVTAILAEERVMPMPESGEHAMAGATFLGQLMFAMQLANGGDPRQARQLLAGDGRGAELAHAFLAAGTVEICCDYCGSLMLLSLAAAAAALLTGLHGPGRAEQAWQALAAALMPPAGPGPEDGGHI